MCEAHDRAVIDRLIIAEVAYTLWDREAQTLLHAVQGSVAGGLVDGQHLVRAGELIPLIRAEIDALDECALTTHVPLTADAIVYLRGRLAILLEDVQAAARELHGLTR